MKYNRLNSKINYINSEIQKLEIEWYKAHISLGCLFAIEDEFKDLEYYKYRIKELQAELFNLQSKKDNAEFEWYKATVAFAKKLIVQTPLILPSFITHSIADTIATFIHKLEILLHTHKRIIINCQTKCKNRQLN